MRTHIALTLAALLTMSTAGCANRPLRNVLHRGDSCGAATTIPTTLPVVSDTTTYSPGCGYAESCPTCGITGGMPQMYGGGYPIDGTIPMPTPGE